jgi:hypothetical protein
MATLEQLQDALVNADKAGDTNAARILADEIVRVRSSQQAPQSQTQLGADRRMADDAQVAEQTAAGRQKAYDQLPWYQQAMQAGQDVGRLLESGATMGFGDKVRAVSSPSTEEGYLRKLQAGINMINPVNAVADMAAKSIFGDKTYEENLKKERDVTQAARDRAQSAALPAELAGALMTGSLAAKNGLTLANRLVPANAKGVMPALARAGVMAPEGATYGIIDALGNDRDVKTGAVVGALGGMGGSIIGDTVSNVASKILPAKTASKVPSLEKLHKAADDAYKASDKAGVMIKPDVAKRILANAQQRLTQFGYHPQNHPGVKVALDELQRIASGNFTLKGIDVARQVTRGGYTTTNPKNNAALEIVVDEIDDAINGLTPNDVIMGKSKEGVDALRKARELWTRVRKNEAFVDAVESARLRAASTGSGGNVENATRQELRRFVDPKIKSGQKNWTPDEAAAIKEIVQGTLTQNTLRLAGKLSPQGNGLMAALGVGGAMTNPVLGVPALGGLAAKHLADRGVQQGIQALDELIRAGGSRAQLQAAQATLRSLSQAQREAIARIVQMATIQSDVGQKQPAQ